MTEDDASKKWCPFSRVIPCQIDEQAVATTNAVVAFNRIDVGPEAFGTPVGSACIAASCMAWRWLPVGAEESVIAAVIRHRQENNSSLHDAHTYVTTHPEYRKAPNPPDTGYCGLAGRPVA